MSKSNESGFFFNEVEYKCRTCFDPGRTVYLLADECKNKKTWRDLLNEVVQLKTSEDEMLPKTLCCKCLDKLISYYDFILQIQNVNRKYSQILANVNDQQQNKILSEVDNFTDCLAESAIALPLGQHVTQIKFEDELVVPYDVLNDSNTILGVSEENSQNEDVNDPFKETCNEEIKLSLEGFQEQKRFLDEDPNQILKEEYSYSKEECSSSSSDESDYVIKKKTKINKSNNSNMSHQEETVEIKEVDNFFICPICQKKFSSKPSCRRHLNTMHTSASTTKKESSTPSSSESDYVLPTCQPLKKKLSKIPRNYYEIKKVGKHFVCPMCKKTFTLQRNCRRHIITIHSKQNTFGCGFCGHHSTCKEYLSAHIKRAHPGESIQTNAKQLVLLFGNRLYSKPAAWRLVKCMLCDAEFSTTKELRQHLPNHRDRNTLHNLKLSDSIVQHWFPNMIDINHIKEVICKDICGNDCFKYYTVLNEYSYEMSVSDTEVEDLEEEAASKYICELCAKEFSYKYEIFSHIKDDHAENEIPLSCSRCELVFVSIKMYEQHRKTHCRNEHKILHCMHCPGKFVWPENMQNHNCPTKMPTSLSDVTENHRKYDTSFREIEDNTKHQENELHTDNDSRTVLSKSVIRCGLCELSFKNLRCLRQHMPLHTDGQTGIDFKSCIYVKQFERSESIDYPILQQQIKNAYIKRQISCFYQAIDKFGNEIDISDSDSDSNIEDNNSENVKKAYACDVCKDMFKERKLLLKHQHERHHTEKLPFTCKDCQKQFVSIHLLQQHLKKECWNEHRRIAQPCDFCNIRFIWPNNMFVHKQIQHFMTKQPVISTMNSMDVTRSINENLATSKTSIPTTSKLLQQTSADVQLRYCFLCPKAFFAIDHLNEHLGRHRLTSSDIKIVETIIHSTWWPNGKKVIKCKICGIIFETMTKLKDHFSSKNTQTVCSNQPHSLASYSITNQKGFELHLELDSETESEDNVEAEGNESNTQPLYPYKCGICSRSFKRKYQIAQHQRSMHNYELLEHKCENCIFRTVSEKILDYHRTTQCLNADKVYGCDQCKFKFMWKENLENHTATFHNLKEFGKIMDTTNTPIFNESVDICDKNYINTIQSIDLQSTSDKNSLMSNDSEKNLPKKKIKVICPICGISTTHSNLSVHIMRHKGEKPFKCNLCEMAFPRTADLQEHRRKHTGERPFKCTICDKAFARQTKLREHKRLHTGERPYQCSFCQKSFNKSDYLKLHMRGHTGEKPYTCDICSKGFVCASYLKKHRELTGHTELWSTPENKSKDLKQSAAKEKKKTLCPICGVYLSSKTNLTFHVRAHTGEKPYKCDLCEMAFKRKSDLQLHRRSHFSDRPFKCTQCDKSFTIQYKLNTHMRMHTGERPYQCTICSKKFNRKEYLNLHMRNHTGEKPFRCEICDQAFICEAYLKKHRVKKGHHVENK